MNISQDMYLRTRKSPLNFKSHPDLKEFLPMSDRGNSTYFADNSRSCPQILMKFFEGWEVWLATKHSVLLLIRITIRSPEFLMDFF